MKRFTALMTADLNGYFQIELVQETDKPLLAETVKLGTHERGHFRLLDTEQSGRFRLCVSFLFENGDHLSAERGAGVKLIRIIQTQVCKDIAAAVFLHIFIL